MNGTTDICDFLGNKNSQVLQCSVNRTASVSTQELTTEIELQHFYIYEGKA